MPQPPRLQATRRTRLDFATPLGPHLVRRARVQPRLRYIERAAAIAIVFDKSKKRRTVEQHRQSTHELWAHSLLVRFVEHHRVRLVMAAATTRDAIGAVRIRLSFEGRKRHGKNPIASGPS